MRLFTISTLSLGVGVVMAGADIQIDFPGFLRAPRAEQNLQTFTGALGGVKAEPITGTSDSKRPFAVGGDTFTKYSDAAVRTCNNQKNACASVANGNKNSGLSVGQCDDQESDCTKVAQSVNPSTIAGGGNAAPPTSTPTQQAPPPETTTQQQAAPPASTTQQAAPAQSSAQQAAPPVALPVSQSSASPVEVSTPTALPAVAPTPTLHSSDEKFFYFCDP